MVAPCSICGELIGSTSFRSDLRGPVLNQSDEATMLGLNIVAHHATRHPAVALALKAMADNYLVACALKTITTSDSEIEEHRERLRRAAHWTLAGIFEFKRPAPAPGSDLAPGQMLT